MSGLSQYEQDLAWEQVVEAVLDTLAALAQPALQPPIALPPQKPALQPRQTSERNLLKPQASPSEKDQHPSPRLTQAGQPESGLDAPPPAPTPVSMSPVHLSPEYTLPAEAARQGATIKRFHSVLREGGSPSEVVNAHTAFLLLPNAQITSDEQAQVELAYKFLKAFFQHDDEALISAYFQLQQSPQPEFLRLTSGQSQQLAEAIQRSTPLGVFQAALRNQRAEEIAAAYQRLQPEKFPTPLSPQEMTLVQLALRLTDALAWDTEAGLAAAYQELVQAGQEDFFVLTPEQRARLQQAYQVLILRKNK